MKEEGTSEARGPNGGGGTGREHGWEVVVVVSSSSMFISRPTPLRAYAVLTLSGASPLMTTLNSLNVHSLHPLKLHATRFPSEK